MKEKEFLQTLTEVTENIRIIINPYENIERILKTYKILENIESFDVSLSKNRWNIWYDNNSCPLAGYFPINEQVMVLPFMLLYTNISYYTAQAKKYVTPALLGELQKLGESIRELCTQSFEKIIITPEKIKKVKNYLEWAKPQLYHIAGPIGECSHRFVAKDAEELQQIREIYTDFKIGYKYIYFYDSIIRKNVKIPIDSSQAGYAICMLFCQAYTVSITWLKKYDPSGQWCPLVPWNIIVQFRMLITELYSN